VLKSTYHAPLEADLTKVVVDAITLVGSRCGPFAPALQALERGTVDVRGLVEREVPLEEGVRALELAGAEGCLKVLIRCN